MSSGPTVAVVGATGTTGNPVARGLARRNIAVRLVGRNSESLAALAAELDCEQRVVVEWNPRELSQAVDGCRVVAACVGPYAKLGDPVVEASINARAHYCDVAAEQDFVCGVFSKYSVAATAAGVAAVTGTGLAALGDAGAIIAAAEIGTLTTLDAVYAMDSAAFSKATAETAALHALDPCMQFIDGALVEEPAASHSTTIETGFGTVTAFSMGYGNALTAPRCVEVGTVRCYFGLPAATPTSAGPDRRARFACRVSAASSDGSHRSILLEGQDPYGLTSSLLEATAVHLCVDSAIVPGVWSVGEVLDLPALIESLGVRIVMQ